MGFPGGLGGKEFACNTGDPGLIPELGRSPWRRKWRPTPVLLPEKSHGQRSLAGYSPWGRKESDSAERLTLAPEPSPAQDPGWDGFGTLFSGRPVGVFP